MLVVLYAQLSNENTNNFFLINLEQNFRIKI